MKKIACLTGLALLALMVAAVHAQRGNPDAIVGTWLNGEKTAHIEISKNTDGKYSGKIVWLKEPVYPANDEKGMAGKEKVDRENPDPRKRSQPVLGLVMLKNFVYSNDSLWQQGQIYDPKNGKEYKCKLTLKSPDVMDVRGFIGFSFIGRTDTWTRVKESTQ